MSQLLAFYRQSGVDHRGRSLREIWSFDHAALKSHHDYIQWLFPLPEGSGVLLQAPQLTAQDIAAFASDAALRVALKKSLEVMLDFYGLERGSSSTIHPGPASTTRMNVWLRPNNHNHLRLTRILRALSRLGLRDDAHALLDTLEAIVAGPGAKGISAVTQRFWRSALVN